MLLARFHRCTTADFAPAGASVSPFNPADVDIILTGPCPVFVALRASPVHENSSLRVPVAGVDALLRGAAGRDLGRNWAHVDDAGRPATSNVLHGGESGDNNPLARGVEA